MDKVKITERENNEKSIRDERVTEYIYPTRVLWKYTADGAEVVNDKALLDNFIPQASLEGGDLCVLKNNGAKAGILLDFGREIHGGIQIITHMNSGHVRVRFGESAMEAMSELGQKGSTNDHAIRDSVYLVSWLGSTSIGNTGFRFVRIDLEDENSELTLKLVRAAFIHRDLEYKGSFESSDQELNKIWQTAAYTVHLNMQEYVWDGIKRDRLVWIGDMHPEVSTIQYVFGDQDCVKKSLDFIKELTPIPNVMNGIPAYSLWWILIHRDWYMQNGDIKYLAQQHDYIVSLVEFFSGFIGEGGVNNIENTFLDWPSSANPEGAKAGVHALFILSMNAAADIMEALGDSEYQHFAKLCADKLTSHVYDVNNNKQAGALQVLAGQADAVKTFNELLCVDGVKGFSTFLGYYILKAMGDADRVDFAIKSIKEYWGKMIELGATSFWEDFNIEWAENCSHLDEILPENTDKKDIHGDFGGYCYTGYRHSLCHGWASGPAPFLCEYVLGIRPIKAGCKQVLVAPDLGGLDYVKGSYPTPYGIIYVEHRRLDNGEIDTKVSAPDEIEIIMG